MIQQMTEGAMRQMLEDSKVINRISPDMKETLEKGGWKIEDYHIEKVYKGYYLAIEFCYGDFCTGVYSKKSKWILEPKVSFDNFAEAMLQALYNQALIDNGKHWPGEDN